MIALNNNRYELAQQLLEELIAQEPQEYFRYPRLATVYAQQGGFDLLDVSQLSGEQEESSGLLGGIDQFLPTPDPNDIETYQTYVNKMRAARDLILEMPLAERSQGDFFYGASAELQLSLYQSAFAVMYMNQFVFPKEPGSDEIDEERLREMTAEDALIILESLADAAVNSEETSTENAQQITSALEEINRQDGDNDREKLIAFIEANQS